MNKFCFIVTHLLNDTIINEYLKIEKSCSDITLFIDNSNGLVGNKKNSEPYLYWKSHKIKYLPFDETSFRKLNLPFCSLNDKNASFRNTIWYNGDYFFYLAQKEFPGYDYYWRFEYDCFFNDYNYIKFFDKYNLNNSDLISFNIRKPSNNWSHIKNIDWLYPNNENRIFTFFPCNRLSSRAVCFLYEKRKEIYPQFIKLHNSEINWPHCELFVATEIKNVNYTYTNLSNVGIFRYKPTLSKEEQLSMHEKDYKLYHPVKENFALETIYL